MTNLKRLARFGFICACISLAALFFLFAARLLAYSENYWWVNPNWFYIPVCVTAVLACMFNVQSEIKKLTLFFCLAFSAIIFASDTFNLLVSYEVWMARGMPERFELR